MIRKKVVVYDKDGKNPTFLKNPDGTFVYQDNYKGTVQQTKATMKAGKAVKLTAPQRKTEHAKAKVTHNWNPANPSAPSSTTPTTAPKVTKEIKDVELQNNVMKNVKKREKNKEEMYKRHAPQAAMDPSENDAKLAAKLAKNKKINLKNEGKVAKSLQKASGIEIGMGATARLDEAIENIEKRHAPKEKKEKKKDNTKALNKAVDKGHINVRRKKPPPKKETPATTPKKEQKSGNDEYDRMVSMIMGAEWQKGTPEKVAEKKGYKPTQEKGKKGVHATVDYYTKKDSPAKPKVQPVAKDHYLKKHMHKEVGYSTRARHAIYKEGDKFYYRNAKKRKVYVKNFLPHEHL